MEPAKGLDVHGPDGDRCRVVSASHLFGAGEVIDIGIALIVAEQGVIELAECVQITVLAMSPKDLDEAASHLARAISIITVFKFASFLARFLKNRGGGGATEKSGVEDEPAPKPVPRAPAVRKLFRAVDTAELDSIRQSKGFTASPNGSEVKGFFFDKADAQDFADKMTDMTGTPHTVVEAEARGSLVSSSPPHSAAGEGPGVYITNDNLSAVRLKQ